LPMAPGKIYNLNTGSPILPGRRCGSFPARIPILSLSMWMESLSWRRKVSDGAGRR